MSSNFPGNSLEYTSLSGENELLQTEIRRLELAIQSTENPLHIARDCLSNRQRRVDTDLVQDDAENNLLKVMEASLEVIKYSILTPPCRKWRPSLKCARPSPAPWRTPRNSSRRAGRRSTRNANRWQK